MGIIIIMGPQAVGKMTVGQELEKLLNFRLLFNHMTIDLLAPFLGYTPTMWELSSDLRLELFKRFVSNADNPVDGITFTVLINFDSQEDLTFLREVHTIFEKKDQPAYFVELETNLETRLKRNITENRLKAKPSKRDLAFSEKELMDTVDNYRFKSLPGELASENHLVIDNTSLSPQQTAQHIYDYFSLGGDS